MTVTKSFEVDGISITIKTPKAVEVTEVCPCDNSIIIVVEDRLLMALQRSKKPSAVPV